MTARDVARIVLRRVEGGAYANLSLQAELGRARLSTADAGLVTELVYGVLKRRRRLDHALAACVPRGIDQLDGTTLDALRMAAHQILFLRVPAHAAVDDAVGAIKASRGDRLAGFANAVLRRLAREGESPLPDEKYLAAYLEVAESCPRWLVDLVLTRLGATEGRALLAAWNAAPPTWLRVNTSRTSVAALSEKLLLERPRAQLAVSELVPEALAVRGAGDLFSTESAARGEFTAQDLGAQLVARLLAPEAGERILDACAGVGGKSTHLAALSGDRATIDAADSSARKLQLGVDLARRLGVTSVRPIEADLTDARAPLLRIDYDRILLDAPCSGLGVLRRHPELKWRRSASEVTALADLQAKLLAALSTRLRPGGLLVYAVCSFTDEEGPLQVERFLATQPEFAIEEAPSAFDSVRAERGSIRSWPQRDDADAFYAVRLRRAA